MINKRVLFVDDEKQILDGMRRTLRKKVDVFTALGAEEGLNTIHQEPPFAVIVSDMRMPGMDGVEFLSKAKELSPDSVRIMLTGNADQETAVKALNTGEVFKFLNKPCEQETLEKVLDLALRQYQLITAEKELLNKTVRGSIEALSEILAIANPMAFGRVKRIRDMSKQIAENFNDIKPWEMDTAALLSQLGCISLPQAILEKVFKGAELNHAELEEYHQHPKNGAKLISKIPRLEEVAEIVSYQHKYFDGSGAPVDDRQGTDIPLGSRILNLVLAYDEKISAGWSENATVDFLKKQANKFDPDILGIIEKSIDSSQSSETVQIPLVMIEDGMELAQDVINNNGVLIACRGLVINTIMRERFLQFYKNKTLEGFILVSCPKDESQEDESQKDVPREDSNKSVA